MGTDLSELVEQPLYTYYLMYSHWVASLKADKSNAKK
jgi:hypothetical protein